MLSAEFEALDWSVRPCLRAVTLAALVAAALIGPVPHAAGAESGDEAKPAPRTAVQIGDASIVLIAANDHLYAFVDRVDDNLPVADAALSVTSPSGAAIDVRRVGNGLFAAPFKRAGHMHDAFVVSLRSAVATGAVPAEIAYDDASEPEAAPSVSHDNSLAIALVSAGIGAIGAGLIALRLQGGWRRAMARLVGPAKAT